MLDRIPVFIAVAEELGFSKAADRLGRTQSAVSQAIALLEEELGTRLFIRDKRRIRLTQPGELLLSRARASMNHLTEALRQIEEWKGLKRGRLRIGSSHTLAYYLLPPVVELFHKTYPDIELIITEILSGQAAGLIERGDIDLALGFRPADKDSIRTVSLNCRQDAVISKNPLKRIQGDNSWEKTLSDKGFLLSGPGMLSRIKLDQIFSGWAVRPRIVMESNNIEVIKKMVMSGLGITVLPVMTVREELENNSLCALPLEEDAPRLMETLFLPSEDRILPAAEAFAEMMIKKHSEAF